MTSELQNKLMRFEHIFNVMYIYIYEDNLLIILQ
jgi:hypothetical protein